MAGLGWPASRLLGLPIEESVSCDPEGDERLDVQQAAELNAPSHSIPLLHLHLRWTTIEETSIYFY